MCLLRLTAWYTSDACCMMLNSSTQLSEIVASITAHIKAECFEDKSVFSQQGLRRLRSDCVGGLNDRRVWVQVLELIPNARGVLVTAGGDGCAYAMRAEGGKVITGPHVPVFSVNVQDTTGAGDAFTCGFLTYLLSRVRSISRDVHVCAQYQ